MDCYAHILGNKNDYHSKRRSDEAINIPSFDDLPTKRFDNSDELNTFNAKFSTMRMESPNDFGYHTERIAALDDDGKNFEDLKRQYSTSQYRPQQLFDKKNFSPQDFNKAFEYQQTQFDGRTDDSQLVIHKTTDGFSGYNSATLDNCAYVSSYNGVLLVGDNFGQSGLGFNEGNYSDYRQTFNAPKNPDALNVPDTFVATPLKVKPLSKSEMEQQLRLREEQLQYSDVGKGSRRNFNAQTEELLEKQQRDLKNKIADDKKFILQYKHLFEEQTIQDALNGNLLTNQDYQGM